MGEMQSSLTTATLRFSRDVASLKTTAAVVAALQQISDSQNPGIRFGAAWYLAKSSSDFAALVPGKTLFISDELPWAALWREFRGLIGEHSGIPLADYGRRQSVPFTLTEARRDLQPTGNEDWIFRMLQRHGIRDGLYCPFRHWTLCFWSGKVLDRLPPDARGMLFMAAGSAIGRIGGLVKRPQRFETVVKLTDRELQTLRLASYGKSLDEIAAHLKIGSETVRTHLKKAARKLKAKNRGHALVEAMRQGLLS